MKGGVVSKKTAKGMPQFLHSWMEREQNNPRSAHKPDASRNSGKVNEFGHPPTYTGITSPLPLSDEEREKLLKSIEEQELQLPPEQRRTFK